MFKLVKVYLELNYDHLKGNIVEWRSEDNVKCITS